MSPHNQQQYNTMSKSYPPQVDVAPAPQKPESQDSRFVKLFPYMSNTIPPLNLIQLPKYEESKELPLTKPKISTENNQIIEFLMFYKTQQCRKPNCSGKPRITVKNNQYHDKELECNFYHHERDQRRVVLDTIVGFNGQFNYKANYATKDNQFSFEKYSLNFFESLFHPLYYKQFACKRQNCKGTIMCPYFHSEQEKLDFEIAFEQTLKLNRKTFSSQKTQTNSAPVQQIKLSPKSTEFSSMKMEQIEQLSSNPIIQKIFNSGFENYNKENYPTYKLFYTPENFMEKPHELHHSIW